MSEPFDGKEVDEVMDEAEEMIPTPDMPEAPQSIHVDAYYKGFHAGFTIRKPSNRLVAVNETTKLIEGLIEKGYKPSWNSETNNGHTETPKSDPNAPICEVHNKPMSLKPSGISKATGKRYPAFWACSERMEDGSFCRYKPAQNVV